MWQQKPNSFKHSRPSVVNNQSGNKKSHEYRYKKIQNTVNHIGGKKEKTDEKNKKLPDANQTDIRKKGTGIQPLQRLNVFHKIKKIHGPK